ncbi:TetR/AcrR family transcriptional regulator [Citricoccus sp. SGAir0253]|uniref:TetR/AcrR family transcriptional regulator n=1 Tax=Citricoccus sp. SGAir0253 TaxID=2567881 RepID=UPI0010CCCD7F|nr:TetR/AcrR family transcriptional regulator [Citricoccus sp. SGAir0253]QCU77207.1 TetR/AcrR family transcriptional regulator [Citricoccus sp. SGAir0253]
MTQPPLHDPPSSAPAARPADVRSRVVEAAVALFDERGFEATSVDDIARAAGVSRSTYFRQVGGKEDAVFADHGPLLDQLAGWMDERAARPGDDPWGTVCAASERVFAHLSADLPLARRRYRVVRAVPALRDREIVTERRYERLFARFLRTAVPGLEPVDAVGFAALVTATHNHVLREAVRSDDPTTEAHARALARALETVRRRFGVAAAGEGPDGGPAGEAGGAGARVVVAAFPTTMPSGEVIRRVQESLRRDAEAGGPVED